MKTFFSKSILLVFMFLGLSMVNLQAEKIECLTDEINIELAVGYTIEDIIQDLHDNASVEDIIVYGSNSTYVIKFNPKKIDIETLIVYLEKHKGVKKVIVE